MARHTVDALHNSIRRALCDGCGRSSSAPNPWAVLFPFSCPGLEDALGGICPPTSAILPGSLGALPCWFASRFLLKTFMRISVQPHGAAPSPPIRALHQPNDSCSAHLLIPAAVASFPENMQNFANRPDAILARNSNLRIHDVRQQKELL